MSNINWRTVTEGTDDYLRFLSYFKILTLVFRNISMPADYSYNIML